MIAAIACRQSHIVSVFVLDVHKNYLALSQCRILSAEGSQQRNVAISEMEQLLQQVQLQGQGWGYSWLPLAAVDAVVWLLAVTILRPAGRMKQALAYFGRAQDAIDSELARQQLGLQVPFDAVITPTCSFAKRP